MSLYNEGGGGPIFPTPVVGHGRQAARPERRCRGARSASRATRSRSSARSRPRPPARSSRSSRAGSSTELPAIDLDAHAAALDAIRERRALGRGRDGARRLRGRARVRARRMRDRRRHRREGRTSAATTSCSARAPAECVLAGPREELEKARRIPASARFSGDRRDGRRPARHRGGRCYALGAGGSCARGPRRVTAEPVRMTPRRADSRSRRPARRVWRLRGVRPGVRRRPPGLLRAVRAPAPRAGVRRDRHLRERPHHDPARPRPRLAGLRRGEAARADGLDGGGPRALLDDRLVGVGERPAGLPLRPPRGRARAQRQPDQRARAPRGALGARRRLPLDLRLGADRGDALDPRGATRSRTRWRT